MSEFPAPPQHRELTQAEVDALVHDAFECEREIKGAIRAVHAKTWTLAEHLYRLSEEHHWVHLGYETLNEWLAQPEIGLSRSSFFRLVQAWRDLVQVKKVAPTRLSRIEPSKVQEVLPAIMAGDVYAEDALADAEALGFRDLREKYRQLRSRGAATSLAAEQEPVRTRCAACGEWTTTPPVLTIREDGVIELRGLTSGEAS